MEGRARLLVVDDDPDVLVVLKTKLEETGRFEVMTAGGGQEALRTARQPTLKPELIISDIDMPDMDGGELAATLKESPRTADISVVFLSALVSPNDSGQSGGWPMLSKRGSLETLIRTIDRMLGQGRR